MNPPLEEYGFVYARTSLLQPGLFEQDVRTLRLNPYEAREKERNTGASARFAQRLPTTTHQLVQNVLLS